VIDPSSISREGQQLRLTVAMRTKRMPQARPPHRREAVLHHTTGLLIAVDQPAFLRAEGASRGLALFGAPTRRMSAAQASFWCHLVKVLPEANIYASWRDAAAA
jgi:hypothetical protein